MRPDSVVVASPALDDDLRFTQRIEDLAIEEFIAQAGIEAFDEAVLPGTARCNIGGPCADGSDPVLHGLGDELGSIVGTDVPGNTRRMKRSDSASMTSMDLSLRATRIARHSWVNSSMMLSKRILRPLWVRSSTKS